MKIHVVFSYFLFFCVVLFIVNEGRATTIATHATTVLGAEPVGTNLSSVQLSGSGSSNSGSSNIGNVGPSKIYVQARLAHTLVAPKWLKTRPIYLDLVNESLVDDVLLKAESTAAQKVTLQYTHTHDGGFKTQKELVPQRILVPARSVVRLKNGGLHLMLYGLKQPLVLGREIPLKLIFEKGEPVYTRVLIQKQPD